MKQLKFFSSFIQKRHAKEKETADRTRYWTPLLKKQGLSFTPLLKCICQF